MKYTREHLEAVTARMMQYQLAALTGTICVGECNCNEARGCSECAFSSNCFYCAFLPYSQYRAKEAYSNEGEDTYTTEEREALRERLKVLEDHLRSINFRGES